MRERVRETERGKEEKKSIKCDRWIHASRFAASCVKVTFSRVYDLTERAETHTHRDIHTHTHTHTYIVTLSESLNVWCMHLTAAKEKEKEKERDFDHRLLPLPLPSPLQGDFYHETLQWAASFNDAAIIICLPDRRRYYYTRTSRQNWREGESQCNTRSNAANIESRQDCTHCKQPSYTNVTQLIPPLLQHSPFEMRGEKRERERERERDERERREETTQRKERITEKRRWKECTKKNKCKRKMKLRCHLPLATCHTCCCYCF